MQKQHFFKASALLIAVLGSANIWAMVPEITLRAEGGNYPVIRGQTNMPDGTALSVAVKIAGKYGGLQNAEVKNGQFTTGRFSVNGEGPLPPGVAIIDVQSPLPAFQNDSVRAVIGQNGENMSGPLIYTLPGISGRMIKASTTIEIP